ncbi:MULTISPECIES: peptidase [Mycolicibacterium]|nr:peptidase [Mycolicibacterium mageritense]MCC9182401.1 peptidase [Mycolicibacterium mageritense]CDO23931.1 neutral zinc metallopeptidase [Mycolicibacterium mageritense DSM 44476 = CIP 104973]
MTKARMQSTDPGRFRVAGNRGPIRHTVSLLAIACCAILLAGCGTTVVKGRATSMLFDPNRVGGLPVTDGNSGLRPDAPDATREVENTDGGEIDQIAALAIDDIEEFWSQNYTNLPGEFEPVTALVSYDSDDPDSPVICDEDTVGMVNAFYCGLDHLIAWDRGVMFSVALQYFQDMGIVGILAHEYGHAIQRKARTIKKSDPVIVGEQQADCFAGIYMRWVAAGKSSRFELSTGEGLNYVLAGIIYSRDPLMTEDEGGGIERGHGSALDRISAFQVGFAGNSDQCAAIDMDEIKERQGDLPHFLEYDNYGDTQPVNTEINEDTLQKLMGILGDTFQPADAPKLSTDPEDCPDAKASPPASYCPATNTISVDIAALKVLGKAKIEEKQEELLQGDNTAISVFMSRYALAVQHEKGLAIDTPVSAMRTGCLTGVAQAKMAEPGGDLVLSPGDADEAIAGLLTNGLAASDVNGTLLPAGFTRILAYRSGLQGNDDQCYQRFP